MFFLFPQAMLRLARAERRVSEAAEDGADEAAPDPDILLDHIAEVSKTARGTWFGLLGLLVFVGVTLLAHKDADFFAYGAETALPLVGITVPVKAFFYAAPVLVAALYIYLQLYLLNLWDALAEAPARVDGQPLADRVFPWLISHAALWFRNRERADGSSSPRPMGRFVAFISVMLGTGFAVLVLFLLWLRSMPAHDEWLTLWIALWFYLATLVGIVGQVSAARRLAGASRASVSENHGVRRKSSIAFALVLAFVSWDTTEGGVLAYRVIDAEGEKSWAPFIPLYPANLREAVLTPRPGDWQPYERWIKGFDKDYRKEFGLDPKSNLAPQQLRAYWFAARDEWTARLAGITAPDMRQADLRNADIAGAFLPGADLRGARLDGANLSEVQAAGVRLSCWNPGRTNQRCASLHRADLTAARLQGAQLAGANLREVNVAYAGLQGANLNEAVMSRAKLWGAGIEGASLFATDLQDANLARATMQGAELFSATMHGAMLWAVDLQGAELSYAKARGAILHAARLQAADLTGVDIAGASLGALNALWGDSMFEMIIFMDPDSEDFEWGMLLAVEAPGADAAAGMGSWSVLSGANLDGADCTGTLLQGASARSAVLTCDNLQDYQLQETVGDANTIVPAPLTVASCLEFVSTELADALAYYPEVGSEVRRSRDEAHQDLLCGINHSGNPVTPNRTGAQVAAQE